MSGKTRLRRLLDGLLERSLTPDDFDELQKLLRGDPAARRAYYEVLSVDHLLAERYELPDYIAIHAQAMDNPQLERRFRNRPILWSLGGAAAAVIALLGVFLMIQSRPPEITLVSSADSHFRIDGTLRDGNEWRTGESLEILHGTVSVTLSPFIEACFEGPCRARLIDRQGHVEVLEGKCYFQIAPGGEGFEVRTPGGIVRDIGTRFGVEVGADGNCEVHVASGMVEIERVPGESPKRVGAGDAVRWSASLDPLPTAADPDRFIQSLPWETVIFADDFSEPDGTRMHGKPPDVGQPWIISLEHNPTVVRNGAFDTSFSPRTATANFRPDPLPARHNVHLITFRTRPPENIDDKSSQPAASERLIIGSDSGQPLFILAADAADGHRWHLHSGQDSAVSQSTSLSAFEANLLTLSHTRESGRVALHQGGDARGPLLAEIQIQPSGSPAFLTASNTEGGDLSLDDVKVRVVTYSRKFTATD